MQNSKNSKEVQGTGTAQELQLTIQALLQKNIKLKARNEHLENCNSLVRDNYKLVVSMNDFLKQDIECYKNGKKPTCSDAVYILDIQKNKIERPNYLLHNVNFLALNN